MSHTLALSRFFLGILAICAFMPASYGADNALEAQAKKIEAKLVAPCCWTYPVSEHHSEAAIKIKRQIRSMLKEGKSEADILAYFSDESRFGERILTTPTTRGFNVMVWIFPFVIFLLGSALLYVVLKRIGTKSTDSKESPKAEEIAQTQDSEYRKRLDDELYRSED